ncbi:MAG: flagellar biosynthesis protein FliC [Melioribacteraceae bacterium]|nr:flagellar biosynthesis protein FliC [Melioribacteraceae bacterium]MCF8353755.1 flagellar biosynthesis protein FliC [Melioribacteraceae bacterium]MCF8392436.1 flagellar biosynthesis protein FliC [Melioribacteraceae bacterium]MCF8418347.1 flagellar biosynthesis protein FliC [Melioribacteraceae bacterium]
MSFRINTNIGALQAYNALAKVNKETSTAQLRLATQKRINSVADDTSGFAVGKSLDQKVKLMQAAQNNVGSAKDMLATAESQLISVKDLITDIRTKIADASNPAADKERLSDDVKALAEEIGNIFSGTKFNDTSLLVSAATGGAQSNFTFQTGVTSSDTLSVNYASGLVGATDLAIGDVSVSASVSAAVSDAISEIDGWTSASVTASDFTTLETNLDTFEDAVDDSLSKIGNLSQRLDVKDEFLTSAISNSQASVSRLFDADMAMEQLNATKGQISGQVATSMLAQMNMAPQNILSLF